MDLPFTNMTYKLLCKEKVLVDIVNLKYGANQNDIKKNYLKK